MSAEFRALWIMLLTAAWWPAGLNILDSSGHIVCFCVHYNPNYLETVDNTSSWQQGSKNKQRERYTFLCDITWSRIHSSSNLQLCCNCPFKSACSIYYSIWHDVMNVMIIACNSETPSGGELWWRDGMRVTNILWQKWMQPLFQDLTPYRKYSSWRQ